MSEQDNRTVDELQTYVAELEAERLIKEIEFQRKKIAELKERLERETTTPNLNDMMMLENYCKRLQLRIADLEAELEERLAQEPTTPDLNDMMMLENYCGRLKLRIADLEAENAKLLEEGVVLESEVERLDGVLDAARLLLLTMRKCKDIYRPDGDGNSPYQIFRKAIEAAEKAREM